MYSSGNMDVRNWLHHFELRCMFGNSVRSSQRTQFTAVRKNHYL